MPSTDICVCMLCSFLYGVVVLLIELPRGCVSCVIECCICVFWLCEHRLSTYYFIVSRLYQNCIHTAQTNSVAVLSNPIFRHRDTAARSAENSYCNSIGLSIDASYHCPCWFRSNLSSSSLLDAGLSGLAECGRRSGCVLSHAQSHK